MKGLLQLLPKAGPSGVGPPVELGVPRQEESLEEGTLVELHRAGRVPFLQGPLHLEDVH